MILIEEYLKYYLTYIYLYNIKKLKTRDILYLIFYD